MVTLLINSSGIQPIHSYSLLPLVIKLLEFGMLELPKPLRQLIRKVPKYNLSRGIYRGNSGENLNISWSPKGETIAVGNKDDLISFIDCKNYKIRLEKQFKASDSDFSSINIPRPGTSDLGIYRTS